MGKGRPRAVEKGVLGHCPSTSSALSHTLALPPAPVYYPSESEFQDPLSFIAKIRPEAESYGICRIVPPNGWSPPFALDLSSFSFPTKSQAIHRLQSRPAACDSATFELEYTRFLENHCGRKPKKRSAVIVFEGEDLSLCSLFNAVKRFGGYDKVLKEKRWGDVFRFVRLDDKKKRIPKITECAKHVLCQLYREHLYDYEGYCNELNCGGSREKECKRKSSGEGPLGSGSSLFKRRRRKNVEVKIERVLELDNLDQVCERCKSGLHGEVMLLCDRCNKGWHLYCLTPPLERVPPGNWYCLECVNSDKDSFGFVPGRRLSLEAFKKLAEKVRRKFLGTGGPMGRSVIERRFWEIVEGSLGKVEVMYGSDLDTSLYGSGFPRENDPLPPSIEPEVWKKYCTSPWNLNNLPKLEGSMLRAVHDNIAGVMVPWLYIGMLFSSFCWHFEDHCFYSMNYLHWGEPKCWYSVPGSEAHAFEQVMRKTLPDLFDAQPDLLFQLVTMLNPSVLQEHGVPVYSVLQEPGNFIITFPRSFHGGFNFGLNCAEAVNFAPADWLPHGGFGAELYRLYHKAAVLSHEELLCVLAKGCCNSDVLPYLEEEIFRVFSKEKTCREKLWANGIIKCSRMSPRKQPEYVGTEEDPTCIICQQYLYLSAIACSCRPSAFVCLEHWEHLCECNPNKHRLLYRHTLAELSDMVHMVTPVSTASWSLEGAPQSRTCPSSCDESNFLTKKVKGCHATHKQLAEDWVSSARQILQMPFSDTACISALKGAEQFLWAGHEMDPVRHMTTDLVKAQKWAMEVRNCLSKVDAWLHDRDGDAGKVIFTDVEGLLCVDPLPCVELAHPKLKAFMEDAQLLLVEIKSVLSSRSCVMISDLETLYSRSIDLPIFLEESEKLSREISSAKVWVDNVRECISETKPAAIEVDVLEKLKTEMLQLCIQFPEMDILLALLGQVESWKIRCNEFLSGPIILKELAIIIQDAANFTVNIPELKLLKQYHSDALSWVHRFHEALVHIQDREDYNHVVEELTCLLEAGESLRVHSSVSMQISVLPFQSIDIVCQITSISTMTLSFSFLSQTVDQLPLVKAELRKSGCREKASKALTTRMPLEFVLELMKEAILLGITKEKLFVDVSKVLDVATSWEDNARCLLGCMGQMSEFEDALRNSENIFALLPSHHDVKDALSTAESWIRASQPFLMSTVCSGTAPDPMLKVDALKELVAQSKLLKVSLKAPEMLQSILKDVEAWELDACSLLEHSVSLSNLHDVSSQIDNGLPMRIEALLQRMHSAIQAGLSLRFDFCEFPKLQNASSMLQWSLKALSFRSEAPPIKDVDSLIMDVELLPAACVGSSLVSSLIDGLRWLRQALTVIPEPHGCKCKLKDVEIVLEEAERIKVPFPMIVTRLVTAIQKHRSWQEQVHMFFSSESVNQSWTVLLQLKELGESDAFYTPELEKVAFEVGKVEKWMARCKDIVRSSGGDLSSLCDALLKIKDTLDRALCIYSSPKGYREKAFCICCSNDLEDWNAITCMTCKDWYHLSCMRPSLANAGMAKEYKCPFCLCIETGGISKNGVWPLMSRGMCPELKLLNGLLHDAKDFYVGIRETNVLQDIADQAFLCKSSLTDSLNHLLAHINKDLSFVYENLSIVLKAVAVAGVYDDESNSSLELALTRSSWKIRVQKVLVGPRKPLIQQIQRLMKEGLAVNIPSEDYFMQKLTELKVTGLQWANHAKAVAFDSGALELEEVFKLIAEGENLPIQFEKELKLLRSRSVLYCICRKPYDQRAMIACDQCDEWYHFDCIKLREPPPKTFICPACRPLTTDLLPFSPCMHHEEGASTDNEPQTPPPRFTESKRTRPRKARSSLQQKMQVATDLITILRCYSETDDLWRKSRRPFRRTARKRSKFESLISPLYNQQQ